MNKLFTKIVGAALGATMAIGVGVAVASNRDIVKAEAAQTTVSFAVKGWGGSTSTSYVGTATSGTGTYGTSSTVAASMANFNPSSEQVRGNQTTQSNYLSGSNFYLRNTAALPDNIREITINVSAGTLVDSKVFAITGSSAITSFSDSTTGATAGTSGTNKLTWTFTGSNKYFAIGMQKGGTSGTTKVSTIEVLCGDASTPLTSIELSGSGVSGESPNYTMSIAKSDTTTHSISVGLTPTTATDPKVKIEHYSGTSGLVTPSASQVTCTSGSGSFTVKGNETVGVEKFKIYGNTETSIVRYLEVTVYDDSKTYWDVTFESNGGSESPAKKSIEDGATFLFPSPGTKEHCEFDGWKSPSDANLYAVGAESPSVKAAITYTAQWTTHSQVTVTYSAALPGSGTYSHINQYVSETYALLPFESLSGITYDSSAYKFKDYTVNEESRAPGFEFTLTGAIEIIVNFETKPASTSKTMSEIVSENGFKVSSNTTAYMYKTWMLDTYVTVSTSGDDNCGSFWGTSPNIDWRLYEAQGGDITISVPTGSELKTITITYNTKNTGALFDGETVIASGETIIVSGASKTLIVDNTGSATNGQAKILSIAVEYIAGAAPEIYHDITFNKNTEDTVTGMPETLEDQTGVVSLENVSKPSRSGYNFLGWSLTSDGSVVDEVTITTSDIELFAIWEEKTLQPYVVMEPGTNGSSCTVNGKAGIKVGTSKAGGDMTITVPAYTTKIKLYAAAWKDTASLSLNISGATVSPSSIALTADDGISGNSPYTLSGNEADYLFELVLSNVTTETTLTLEGSNTSRFVVWAANLTADSFANIFTSTSTCNSSGTSQPSFASGYSWSEYNDIYNTLDQSDKDLLNDAEYTYDGTTVYPVSPTTSAVANAMAKYDYIVGKYFYAQHIETYNDFIERHPSPIGSTRGILGTILGDNSSTVAIIIVVSAITLTSIGGYFFIRRRKHN